MLLYINKKSNPHQLSCLHWCLYIFVLTCLTQLFSCCSLSLRLSPHTPEHARAQIHTDRQTHTHRQRNTHLWAFERTKNQKHTQAHLYAAHPAAEREGSQKELWANLFPDRPGQSLQGLRRCRSHAQRSSCVRIELAALRVLVSEIRAEPCHLILRRPDYFHACRELFPLLLLQLFLARLAEQADQLVQANLRTKTNKNYSFIF